MQLNLTGIEYTYPGSAEPVLRGVTATFPRGWTGVVGDNGCGKTTLARIACGQLSPDSGSVTGGQVGVVCEQDCGRRPGTLEDFACAYDRDAVALRAALGIEDDWAWRFDTLSGGQRKRLQVACALWARPDLLVMDEPTNHVDAPTREAIARALGAFDGVGLLISHDRALLDELCARCLFMGAGRATMRQGGWSQGSGQAGLERESALRARERAVRERSRLEREARRRREEASRSAGMRSAGRVDPRDGDAKDRIRLAIYTGKDGVAGHLSSQMGRRLAEAERAVGESFVPKRYDGDVWVDAEPSPRRFLVRFAARALPMGGGRSLDTPDLTIGGTEHVALAGPNGCGKSTLVRAIVGQITRDPVVTCCYVPQEPDAGQVGRTMAELARLDDADRGRAMSVIARLNSSPGRILEGGELSPGELRKVMLALGVLRRPNLVVMDEPTNHLDIHSTEALQALLAGYPGALLLASHDERLLSAVTSTRWEVGATGDGGARLIAGTPEC